MNFKQRLLRYGIGVFLGVLISLYFFGGRGCGDWMPTSRIKADIQRGGIVPDEKTRCELHCVGMSVEDLELLVLNGTVNVGASSPRETPRSYRFVLGASAENGPVSGITFLLTDTASVATALAWREGVPPPGCGCD